MGDESTLPVGTNPPALVFDHFPSTLHAVVWRNWNHVPAERPALTLGGSVEALEEVAISMGLPPSRAGVATSDDSIYITILRRNWHLLPYEQILTLLDRTAEELAFSLKEDDFLFHKLGNLKPKCERVEMRKPTAKEVMRAADIRRIVEQEFPDGLAGGEAPLGFVKKLNGSGSLRQPAGTTTALRPRLR